MKIAYVITRSDEIGGAQVHLKDLAVYIKNQGHEVVVFAGGCGIFSGLLVELGIQYTSLKYMVRPIRIFNDIKAVFELAKKLKEFSPDVVAAHSFKAGLISRLACVLARKKCIFTAHGWSFIKCASPIMKHVYIAIEKTASLFSDSIITVCEHDRDFAIASGICHQKKLKMIYNGIPDIDKQYFSSHANSIPKIIMVARFDWPKDHGVLIKALGELKDLSWQLELVGDGPYLNSIKSSVADYGIEDKVLFLGRRDDVAQLLSQSDVFVLVSHAEGFPISIIEAMRARLPVVATNTGGISESVIDGKTGFLVEDNDYLALKKCLQNLILNSSLRAEMGASGRHRYEKYFTIDAMVNSTVSIYRQAIS